MPAPSKDNRRRHQLNLSEADHADLKALTELERASTTETIRRSVRSRLRMHLALQPKLRYPLIPDDKLPDPERLAFVNTITGEIRYIELG